MLTKQRAFTLIELMIVIAIVGTLTAVAVPSYKEYVTKARRIDAQGALMGFANAMERHFTANASYCDAAVGGSSGGCGGGDGDLGTPSIFAGDSPTDGGTVYYNLAIVAITDTTYNLRATPVNSQVDNGVLEINETESKGRWDSPIDGVVSWR